MVKFTATGHGRFPIDMLRYDQCWPLTEDDSYEIVNSLWYDTLAQFTVALVTNKKEPTDKRWISFGWEVKKDG